VRHLRRALALLGLALLLLVAATPLVRPRLRERALRAAPKPLDVVLLTLDTTRADHLGCYGFRGAATPHLDVLARDGVLFQRAYAHVPLTCPSHASLMTGLTPARHGVHDNGGFVLGPEPPTLAEQFVEAGYRTGAFVSAFVLDRRWGLARGFATYEDELPRPAAAERQPQEMPAVTATVTVSRAMDWLRRDDGRPVLLWVHLYDPHAPYEPPEPFAARYRESPYDGEIAYMDTEVGRLLDLVAERRRAGRPTLVAAIGDHGEALGEHGEVTHNYFIYSATQRVPFMLSLPGYLPEGGQIEPVVRGVDLMPTLLDIARLPIPPGLDGQSLVTLITGSRSIEPAPAYLESYHPRLWWGAHELLGLRTDRWLFIQSPRPELYDVEQDPGELRNLAAQRPVELERLGARLKTMVAEGDPLAGRSQVDVESARQLQALGYVGGGPPGAQIPSGPLPDAKDNAALLEGFTKGVALANKGRSDEALAAFRETLELNPRSASVRVRIAETLFDLRRFEESFAAFAELNRERPDEHYSRAMALSRAGQGNRQEALAIVRDGLRQFPGSPRLHEQAGMLLLDLGRHREAEAELRKAVDLAPGQASSYLHLATALEKLGRLREAAASLREVVERNPRASEAREAGPRLAVLGEALFGAGAIEEARKAYSVALEAGESSEETYLNLASVHYRLGRRVESLEVLREGALRFPASSSLHYRAGRVLEELSRRPDAEKEYRKALELDGARNDVREALARLQASP
jgi:arylsulfatase A-like enzyme/Flp pilus assembly protein TadD